MLTRLDRFTSTGVKFWLHPEKMQNYRNGDPNTVISTHIAPEGACNLDCSYCSVHKRTQSERLDVIDIYRYAHTLQQHGLEAVILTGGGEPTAYRHFNLLVTLLYGMGLKIGLITNGTLADRVDVWDKFSWVRVSINNFDNWRERIRIPKLDCTVGCSYIYTEDETDIEDVAALADELNAEYIRVLPDCRIQDLEAWHKRIDEKFDERFMHQYKVHEAPRYSTCHQSYFRPYLHESGFVYPCDSVVLNRSPGKFLDKFRLCHWSEIADYLNHKIPQQFDPTKDCTGCVFTNTVNMLGDYKEYRLDKFQEYAGVTVEHSEFV